MLIALKLPPMVLAVYFTWVFLAKAPPPIDVIAEWEAEEAAEKAAKTKRRPTASRSVLRPQQHRGGTGHVAGPAPVVSPTAGRRRRAT